MGVYIKSMTLDEFSEYGDYCQTLIGTGQAKEIQPHGRLIDADALIDDVRRHSESYFADDFAHEWVDKAPTIILAEEG